VIPGPPQLGIREIEHQLRMVRGGRRANAVALVRGEVARPQRQLPLGAVTGRFGFEVHFHGRPFVHQARVHRHVADASGRSRHQAHTTRDAQCGDVVRLLVHIAVGALDVIGAVAPVVSDRRPDAHQQLVFRVELHLPGHVVIVGIDVAFVAAERVPVQECVGIIVGGVEFEAQLLSGHGLRNPEALAVPPLLVADPVGIVGVDLSRVQPLYMRASWYAHLAPLRVRPGALFSPRQLPLAVQGEDGRLKRGRGGDPGFDVIIQFAFRWGIYRKASLFRPGHLHQQRVAQDPVLLAGFHHGVVALPAWKRQGDLGAPAGRLGLEAPRADAGPVQLLVQRHNAQSAVILLPPVVDRMAAGQLLPWARADFVIRRLFGFGPRGPAVFGAVHKAVEGKVRQGTHGGEAEASRGRPFEPGAIGGPRHLPGGGCVGQAQQGAQRAGFQEFHFGEAAARFGRRPPGVLTRDARGTTLGDFLRDVYVVLQRFGAFGCCLHQVQHAPRPCREIVSLDNRRNPRVDHHAEMAVAQFDAPHAHPAQHDGVAECRGVRLATRDPVDGQLAGNERTWNQQLVPRYLPGKFLAFRAGHHERASRAPQFVERYGDGFVRPPVEPRGLLQAHRPDFSRHQR